MSVAIGTLRRPWRFGFWTGVFFVLLATFGYVTVLRFTRGLGATTNLSDRFPWGLWIGFDILCGVGLAAARARLVATWNRRMGESGCSWSGGRSSELLKNMETVANRH